MERIDDIERLLAEDGEAERLLAEDEGDVARPPAIRAIGDFLYPEPAPRSVPEIVRWWEKRRLPYNLIVGGAGLFSTFYLALISSIPPGRPDVGTLWIPIPAILAVGVAANVMYFLGSIVESISLKLFDRSILPIGPALYRMGLTFSVGLMLLPTVLWTLFWVLQAIGIDI